MKVLVIGESCKDIYCYGESNRMCPEAPVPVFNPINSVVGPGMAMNVKKNIESLGVEADIITNQNWENVIKTRYIDRRTNYMFMRLDENDRCYNNIEDVTVRNLDSIEFEKYDTIVISDYNKGFLLKEQIEYISKQNSCVFLDTKKILGDWCNSVKFIKINEYEYKRSKHVIDHKIEKLKEKLIITLGSRGSMHKHTIYPVSKVEIKDLSGAGDTFISGLVVEYIRTKDIEVSIQFANQCATKVVQKRGVSTV
jgi:bifunctional ADP-heptose synthase (sugar kinase/adenylyltransferase)